MGKFIDIQNEVIEKFRIDLCDGTKCQNDWSRTHAHPKKRRVCKWVQKNSILSTFTLFHEIGHIESNNGKMRRCEQEFHATVWAIEKCKEYGILEEVPDNIKKRYQDYIYRELERGIRRGGSGYPSKEELTLVWEFVQDDCSKISSVPEKKKEKETKRKRFVRVAEQRTQKVLDDLKALSKCAHPAVYEYSEEDIKKIFEAIDREVQLAKDILSGKNRFSLLNGK